MESDEETRMVWEVEIVDRSVPPVLPHDALALSVQRSAFDPSNSEGSSSSKDSE